MGILKEVVIRNFKSFRSEVRVPLTQGTYLAGPNNSGKTAILEALRCFFDNSAFQSDYINRTELTARQVGFNRSDIAVVLDLGRITGERPPAENERHICKINWRSGRVFHGEKPRIQ